MYLKVISRILQISEIECFKRLKKIETDAVEYLEECGAEDQNQAEALLNYRDTFIVEQILKRQTTEFLEIDTALEIVVLYYYIMHIFHGESNLKCLENYFGINNFQSIVFKNITQLAQGYQYAGKQFLQ